MNPVCRGGGTIALVAPSAARMEGKGRPLTRVAAHDLDDADAVNGARGFDLGSLDGALRLGTRRVEPTGRPLSRGRRPASY